MKQPASTQGMPRAAVPRVEAVLLDLYETLVHADWAVLDAGRAALAARAGVEPASLAAEMRRTQALRFSGMLGAMESELAEVLAACGGAAPPGLVRELAALERATWARGVSLYDDALPTVRALRRRGYRLAIVSNCGCQTAAWIEDHGLGREVDALVLSCDVGVLKPDPTTFRAALDRLGVAAERAVFVDDLPENLDVARALGLRTALMARGGSATPGAAHPVIGLLDGLWPLLGDDP